MRHMHLHAISRSHANTYESHAELAHAHYGCLLHCQLFISESMDASSESETDSDACQKNVSFMGLQRMPQFDQAWTAQFPCVKAAKKDRFSFLCTVCNKVISWKHQGVKDVKRHVEGLKHSVLAKETAQQSTPSFRPSSEPINEKVLFELWYLCTIITMFVYRFNVLK